MTIQALGTDAANSLTAFVWESVAASQASVAAINAAILDDQNPRHPLAQTSGCGGFVKEGLLYVPNRGFLTLFPGDVVALDATSGQVILLAAFGVEAGPWTLAGGKLGTNANNSLLALVWTGMATATADVRTINMNILDDQSPVFRFADVTGAGGFVKEGILYVPNRGALTLFPGDIVAVDDEITGSGQPILLTAYGLSAGPWTLT